MDVAAHLQARHVVMLEHHALALQVADLGVDVVDLPGDRGGLVRAGIIRAVDVDDAVAALQHDQLVALLVDLLRPSVPV